MEYNGRNHKIKFVYGFASWCGFFTHFIGEHFIIQIIQIKNKLFARRINQTQLAKERIENML